VTGRRWASAPALGLIAALASLTARVPNARADAGRVVLLEPAKSPPGVHRCLVRIREELTAGGFSVAIVDPGPATDPISMAAAIERQRDAVATIALLGDPDSGSSELWIFDRVGAEAQVRRIPVPTDDPDRTPGVLAIRTIEVLRASALKLLVESNPTTKPEPAPSPPATLVETTPVPVSGPEPRFVFGLEAGVSTIGSPGGLTLAALPVLRARIPIGDRVNARLTLAGFGTRPTVETPRGSATIAQRLALVELGWLFRDGARLRPVATFGVGAMWVQIEGQGVAPYRGTSDDVWAMLADGGVGLLASLGRRVALSVEVHALVAFPYPLVRFVDLEAATIGRPALLGSLTLVVWL
jgi:hypothetical protein